MISAMQILTTIVLPTFALKSNPGQGGIYSPDYDGNPFNQIIYDDPLLLDHASVNDLMEHVQNLWTTEILNMPNLQRHFDNKRDDLQRQFNGMRGLGEK